ncbi:RidA family protein [Cytophagaceae bacterium YF14B1]|uniref:RidA family protein n=1 Tax=Xanthocytophaga flava TaxID=3048013 RepID=A0AAE3U758_9BACT|nr:RidA family protein [Xanthocytophaga flavus]MDJ1481262.1 RidA family protein [Xanthocytophaga flavus]
MNTRIRYINPAGLSKNPAFSQAVITEGPGKTIYVGGQNAVNANGEIIGKGNLKEQTEQALQNVQIALTSCGADFENIVKLSVFLIQGQNPMDGFAASQKFMSKLSNPPAVSVLLVSGLGNPDFLVEIEAIAFIPD